MWTIWFGSFKRVLDHHHRKGEREICKWRNVTIPLWDIPSLSTPTSSWSLLPIVEMML
jgi:hypothetical protein